MPSTTPDTVVTTRYKQIVSLRNNQYTTTLRIDHSASPYGMRPIAHLNLKEAKAATDHLRAWLEPQR
jgi:hypothetical protein